ncbi:MAG TPA: RHS repeat protein [Flavihumibacter sp.]|nr:RHS repeat protein [Bacteroidota bacterium]HOA38803.1 RHS repeat protein [Flavihumibacter sp.]HPZ88929.1 RHS repeat protein [Flavihumibacter sp.]HQD11069.1 RHS repeat protein [Flavihumibacter sp.]
MKNILFGLFLLISFPVCSQYYYKDLVSTRQTAQQFSLLKKAGVKKLVLHSTDGSSGEAAGFDIEQVLDASRNTLTTITKTPDLGNSYLVATYNAADQLVSTTDSAENAINVTNFSYDAAGRILAINSSSRSDNIANTESHLYTYNEQGQPISLLRIRNGKDSSQVQFLPDENGRVGEEKTIKSTLPTPSYYYYHDANGKLTDIVRFNVRAARMLPDYIFEYNAEGQLKKTTIVPEGSNEYQVWYYQYSPDGLRKMDLVYNKKQQLMGKVEYEYSR